MPNYRYNSPDYMRQNGCMRQTTPMRMSTPQPSCPVCRDHSDKHDELSSMPLAMAYVPWQKWRNLYECGKGLDRGTIFEELDKPFRGIGGCSR